MPNFLDLVQSQLGGGVIDQLSKQIGGDPQQTSTAANSVVATLLGALSKNASTTDGASALAGALDRDHDGSILNDITGFLGGGGAAQQTPTANGAGILQHLLGDKLGGITQMISQNSGLNASQSGSLLTSLAPLLMGMLGQQKQQNGLDAGGVASLLTGAADQQAAQNPIMGLVSQFLDKDHDGSILDDLAGMGMNMFFKK